MSKPSVKSRETARSAEFPNGMKKVYTYGSFEFDGESWRHVTDAADNSEPMRTLCERAVYYDAGEGWVEQPLYRADWHEHSEGYFGDRSEAWIEKQYVFDCEAEAWALVWEFDWTTVGDEPYHAQGGSVEFEGNGSFANLYTADAKGDVLEIAYWFDENPSTEPTYKVDRAAHRAVETRYRPPGYTETGVDATYAYNEDTDGGENHQAYGMLVGSTDFLDREATQTLDITLDVVTGTTDIAGNTTASTYNADRRPLTATDTLGFVSTMTYNADGNMLTSEDHLGRVSTYTYYSAAGKYGGRQTSTSPEGVVTTTDYDVWGHTISSVSSTGVEVTYAYTTTGVPRPVLESVTDNLENTTTYEYDSRGLRTAMVDPLGKRTEWVYDAAGRLKSVTNPLEEATAYEYDAHGRLAKFTDERGLETAYAYDASSRLLETTEEDATTTTYVYAAGGCACGGGSSAPSKPTSMTTRKGETFAYEYDVLGRTTLITYPSSARTVTFDYTAGESNPYGALASAHDTNFGSGWGENYDFEYTYDEWGRPLAERFPDGHTVGTSYDEDGRLESVAFDTSSFVTTYAYDALLEVAWPSRPCWRPVAQASPPALKKTRSWAGCPCHLQTSGPNLGRYYAYDAASRTCAEVGTTDGHRWTRMDAGPAGGVFDGWEYEYDDSGQLTR